jgi:hypothetical protein
MNDDINCQKEMCLHITESQSILTCLWRFPKDLESDYAGVLKEPDPLMTKSLVFTDVSGQFICSHLQKSTLRVKIKLTFKSLAAFLRTTSFKIQKFYTVLTLR